MSERSLLNFSVQDKNIHKISFNANNNVQKIICNIQESDCTRMITRPQIVIVSRSCPVFHLVVYSDYFSQACQCSSILCKSSSIYSQHTHTHEYDLWLKNTSYIQYSIFFLPNKMGDF